MRKDLAASPRILSVSRLDMLRERGVVEETRKAVEMYNGLAGSRPVGGLFDSTC
jgi:hypothetical protein